MNQYIQIIFKKCEQLIRFRMLSSSSIVYSSSSVPPHIPIMKSEIVKYTQPKPGQVSDLLVLFYRFF